MKIRLANQNDALAITECVAKAYQHYTKRLGKPPGPMLNDYAQIIAEHIVYVAESQGVIIGLFVLMENYNPILLDNLAVDPESQGTGVGSKLLVFAEQIARKYMYESLQLYTHELMFENIDYYRNHGYQITHEITEKGYNRVYMSKQL